MPGYRPNQHLESGFTILELMVGVAVTAIISAVLVGLLRAGIISYRATARTQFVLLNARRSLYGDGPVAGILTDLQGGRATAVMPASMSVLLPSSSDPIEYDIVEGSLWRTQGGSGIVQAEGTGSLQASYYRKDAGGRIAVAASESEATFVTVQLILESDKKTSTFFTGAMLRNAP